MYEKIINNFNEFQKQKIYSHYLATMLKLKYDFEIVDKKDNWKIGRSTPHKECLGIAFYWLWHNINILSFQEFISDKNIKIIDLGEDWQKNGFAIRIWTQYNGVYDWYKKFANEIFK